MTANKDVIHECPNCECAIAGWISQMNGGWHEVKVYRAYRDPPSSRKLQGGRGTTAVSYSVTHIGTQTFVARNFQNVNHAGNEAVHNGDNNHSEKGELNSRYGGVGTLNQQTLRNVALRVTMLP